MRPSSVVRFVWAISALAAGTAGAQCLTAASGGAWQNASFASQSGGFTAEFDATPSASPVNSVVGLSQGAQTTYTGLAAIVRFNPTGQIDARNGGAYAAAAAINYSAGVTYHFRLAVDVATHRYSAFVTPPGESERTIGSGFAFRTEQSGVTSLNNWSAFTSSTPSGTTTACALAITPVEPPPGRTFRVSSISELQSRINSALPGDRILVTNGVYTTSGAINVARQGTAASPITIAAENIGGAEIRGSAGFSINSPSAFIIVRGFRFTHAAGGSNVRSGTHHVRVTRNVYQLTGTGSYLTVSGDDGEVDHNTFQNKSTTGQMLSVQGGAVPAMAQRTWIHHNYFHDFTSVGGNGGETMRVGLSSRSLTDAHTLVENNLFVRCDGENELISNKSSSNTYRYNTFRDTVGELTLRHGNDCIVHSNFFINSHGVRFFGDDHRIFSNYFERCDPAIQIGNGDGEVADGAPLTSHDRPDRVRVSFNTLVNNVRHALMPGRTGGLGATNLVFSNNIIQGDSGSALTLGGPTPGAVYQSNILFGSLSNGALPSSGVRRVNPLLARDASGVFRLSSGSPAIDTAAGTFPEATLDMDAQARSGAKDVGADEFSSAPITNRPLTTADVGPSAP
jgi:poly(beta-D-mannuronate) lyase